MSGMQIINDGFEPSNPIAFVPDVHDAGLAKAHWTAELKTDRMLMNL